MLFASDINVASCKAAGFPVTRAIISSVRFVCDNGFSEPNHIISSSIMTTFSCISHLVSTTHPIASKPLRASRPSSSGMLPFLFGGRVTQRILTPSISFRRKSGSKAATRLGVTNPEYMATLFFACSMSALQTTSKSVCRNKPERSVSWSSENGRPARFKSSAIGHIERTSRTSTTRPLLDALYRSSRRKASAGNFESK